GEVVADHVEADQEQAFLRERGRQRFRDLAVAPGELAGYAGPTRCKIAARLSRLGYARKRVRHGLAGNQEYALVAVPNLRYVALRHDRAAAVMRDGLDTDVEVLILFVHPDHRSSAHAVQRLQNDVAVLGKEFADRPLAPRDDRRRGEPGKACDSQFFVPVADRPRPVEPTRPLRFRNLEEVGAD